MLYEDYISLLKSLAVEKDRLFTEKLVPNAKNVLGVTLPKLRELAKKIAKGDFDGYLLDCNFFYYEETFLYGLILCYLKADFDYLSPYLDIYISKIDNWAVCDSVVMTLHFPKTHLPKVYSYALRYLKKQNEFENRFAILLLMKNFLTDEYLTQTIEVIDGIKTDFYYTKMAIAWTLCEIVIKHKDAALSYLPKSNLDDFTINKCISKCNDSFRVAPETKEILKKYKRK